MHFKRHPLFSNQQKQAEHEDSQQNYTNQPCKPSKNPPSQISHFPNNQKLHKLQLKTLSSVNNYLKISSSNPQFSSNRKSLQNQKTPNKKHFSHMKDIQLRSYSLPIKNQIQTSKDHLKKNHLKHKEIKEDKKPHNINHKKKHLIRSPNNPPHKISLQQKIITDRLSESSRIGNSGSLKPMDPIKVKWRQLNNLQTKSTRAGDSLQLFNNRMATNQQLVRQRVQSRIMKSQQKLRAKSLNLKSNLLQTSKTKQSQNYNLQLSKGRITPNKNFPFIKKHNKHAHEGKKLLIGFTKQNHQQKKVFVKDSLHQQSSKSPKIMNSSLQSSYRKKQNKSSFQMSRSKLQINSRKLSLFPKKQKGIENKKGLCL